MDYAQVATVQRSVRENEFQLARKVLLHARISPRISLRPRRASERQMCKFRNWVSRATPRGCENVQGWSVAPPLAVRDGRWTRWRTRKARWRVEARRGGVKWREGRWRGQRETIPKPAISIGHLGVRLGSRGGSEGAPPRGANVWQLKSTPSRFHLPLCHRRQPPSSSKAPRRGKNFLGVGWVEGVLLFSQRIAVSLFLHSPTLCCCSPTPTIILGSVHKNRGNKDPFLPTRRGKER